MKRSIHEFSLSFEDVYGLPGHCTYIYDSCPTIRITGISLSCKRSNDFLRVWDIFSSFPFSFYQLHPDVSVNYQPNRYYTGDQRMLTEMRTVSLRIHTYADLQHEFLALAEKALAEGDHLKAVYYLRDAEFFMFPDESAKLPTREGFLHLVREHYGINLNPLTKSN